MLKLHTMSYISFICCCCCFECIELWCCKCYYMIVTLIKASNSYYSRACVSFTSQLHLIEAYCLSVNSVLRIFFFVSAYCWCYWLNNNLQLLTLNSISLQFNMSAEVVWNGNGSHKCKYINLQQRTNNSYFSLFLSFSFSLSLSLLVWKICD